ncbi:MAG: TolC family protein [Tepidisphaeraceae bacterium]
MRTYPSNTLSRFAVAACLLAVALSGCGRELAAPDTSVQITRSTATTKPVVLRPYSQGPPKTNTAGLLSFDDAVATALERSAELQAALARVHAALADARQARLLPNPVLSAVVRFPEGGGQAVIEAGLSAELLAFLQRPRAISAADHRLRAASSEALTAALDIVTEVKESYARVQALEAEALVLDDRRRILDRLLELARARVEVGESSRLDVIVLDVLRAEFNAEAIQTATEIRDERLKLARLIGQPHSNAEWKLKAWQPPAEIVGDQGTWVAVALQRRPEVQAHIWELAALGDEAAATKLALFDGGEVGVEGEREEGWSVGPSVSVPLPVFDWGQARRQKAEARVIEARHKLVQAKREVVEEVRRTWEALASARRATDTIRSESIPAQERRRAQVESAYRNGLADITAVLLAEQDLQASQSKLIESEKNTSLALARLERAVGGAGVAAELQFPTTRPTTQAVAR